MKFGAFFEYLEQHDSTFDRIASGHYALVERVAEAGGLAPEAQLALTPDAVKDQTYFLAHLKQAQLASTLFPLGHLTKAQARRAGAGLHWCSKRVGDAALHRSARCRSAPSLLRPTCPTRRARTARASASWARSSSTSLSGGQEEGIETNRTSGVGWALRC